MVEDALDASRASGMRRLLYLQLAFPVVMVAAAFAMVRFDLGWLGAVLLVAIAMVMTPVLIRATQQRAKALGCMSPAMQRYNRRMLVSSMAYMAILFLSVYLYAELQVRGAPLWGLALATIMPVLGMIWAMGRLLVEETDEYLRSRIVRQALFGLGGVLVVTTVWGFLEQFMLVPHVPSWAVLPLFAIMLGLSQLRPANRR